MPEDDERYPGLFDRPAARRTDPGTSWEAADSIDADIQRESQREVIGLFERHGPMTLEQLVNHAHDEGVIQSDSGIRTRCKEVMRQGHIVATGELVLTKSGRRARVLALRKGEGNVDGDA